MPVNFTGSVYNESSSGDLTNPNENPYWAFGTGTTINGFVGPSDSDPLYNNFWQDSIAIDVSTYSGVGDPQHSRALEVGHTYRLKLTMSASSLTQFDVKFEMNTVILKQMQFTGGTGTTYIYDITVGSNANFYNVVMNGWGNTASGALSNVNYSLSISDITPVTGPDLTVTMGTVPNSVAVGSPITISGLKITNQGNASVSSSALGTYLSKDAIIDSSDIFLGEFTIQGMNASSAIVLSSLSSLSIPGSVAAGTYYIGVVADYKKTISETNENNNVATTTISVTGPATPPDLTARIGSVPSSVNAGESFTISSLAISNIGGTGVSDQTLGVYLSTDSTIDSSDVFLGQFSTGAIASNKSYLGNLTTLALPDDLASGTYFVGVVADYKKSIAESNEGNNIAVASIEVKRIEPDIQVSFSGLKESIVAAGSPIVLDDLRISNDGDADAQQVSVAVYLSDDAVIDSSDNYLGRYTVDEILAGGAKLIDLTTVAIPEDLESGTYYVGVVADGSNTIKESDENNNTSIARPVRVLSADEIDPDTGLPFLAGFATKLSSISVRGANAVYDTGKFVYDTARQVWLATKDGQTFESDSGLGSDDIVEYLTDQVHDNLIDFAREELEDDPLALAALDRYEQTQNALTFKELTSNFLNKTMARIENTVTDYLDPTKSENERRDLDLDAVEADLKKYWEDLVDLQTGLPVNQTLGTLSRIFNSIRMNFGNSALEGRLDIDPSEGGTRTMTAASGHHDATMGSESNDRIFGGDLIDLIYARGGDDYINGGHGADILIGSEGNDQLYGGVGADIISGGLGNDIMSGGTGFDRFVIGTDAGVDRILDFAAGRKSKEIIEIRSDIVGSLAELKASSIRTAEGLLITVDEDQTLLLENVASKQLHLNDFAFL